MILKAQKFINSSQCCLYANSSWSYGQKNLLVDGCMTFTFGHQHLDVGWAITFLVKISLNSEKLFLSILANNQSNQATLGNNDTDQSRRLFPPRLSLPRNLWSSFLPLLFSLCLLSVYSGTCTASVLK